MRNVADSVKLIDSFDMRLEDIRNVDLDQLHQLSVAVGWPQRAEDWKFLIEVGRGYVAIDEIDRVACSAMWFPYEDNVATLGMMITSPRLQSQGTAQWLVGHVLEECQGRELRVNSPFDIRRFFTAYGFKPLRTAFQYQGICRPAAEPAVPDGLEIRSLDHSHLPAVAALDLAAFGAGRAVLLKKLIEEVTGFGLFAGDQLLAFSFCRPFGRGAMIGPIVASGDDQAMAVVLPFLSSPALRFVRVDTPVRDGSFVDFLTASGLDLHGSVTSMRRPASAAGTLSAGSARTYGLASHTLG